MTLDVPEFVTLSDGTSARVMGVAAAVVDGGLARVVYTLEKASGAWAEVAREDVAQRLAAAQDPACGRPTGTDTR